MPKGEWLTWLIEAGRGFGKTRVGSEWTIEKARQHPFCRIALGGQNPDDYRDTMIEGESGILACSPKNFMPSWEASKRRLTWPNGSRAVCFSGETPDALRGPQHHFAWIDELCKFKHITDFIDNLMFGLRLGANPQIVVTTTPRPTKAYLELRNQPDTVITGGSTYENLANLSPLFKRKVIAKYEGTRLGRQELNAELLLDVPGALWKREALDALRLRSVPLFTRKAVAIDPAVTADEEADETGLVVGGVDAIRHGYLLEDCSGRYSPGEWGRLAVQKYLHHECNVIIAEKNQGGDMVRFTIETAAAALSRELGRELVVPVQLVHASQSKVARAEPVAALHEQGRLHHLGTFGQLEDQLCTWLPGEKSPDRLDAYVWLMWGLLLDIEPEPGLFIL